MVNNKGLLKAIAAVSPEGILAVNGYMPWHVSEDLRRFKKLTTNCVIIYGKGTWLSFNKKPLPNRENFLISTSVNYSDIDDNNIVIYSDINTAISDAQLKYPKKTIWIIGGASIYEQTLAIVDELYLTIIKEEQVYSYESQDNLLFFPDYPTSIDSMFNLYSERETEYATYRKYIRKASNFRNPTRSIFTKAHT